MPKNISNIKEDILLVTRQLLKETGYEELNIRKIAAHCGIATGTLYNYYDSKNKIVAEILTNDWNLMLRRVDFGIKTLNTQIEKLEVIFKELSIFMKDVHGNWFDTIPANSKDFEVAKIRERKGIIRKQLAERIMQIINENTADTDTEFKSDVISRILISYSHDDEIDFNALKPTLLLFLNRQGDSINGSN